MSKLLDAFYEKEGTLEEFGGDIKLHRLALGYFTVGWEAREDEIAALRSENERLQKAVDAARNVMLTGLSFHAAIFGFEKWLAANPESEEK